MRYDLLTDDTYNGTYAVEQVREGSGPPVFIISGVNSYRLWDRWQRLVDTRYPYSPVYQVMWPNMFSDSPQRTYKNPVHKFLSLPKDNPVNDYYQAKERAERCGRLLADYIGQDFQGQYPVIIGHSLGARIAATAAKELTQRYGAGRLDSVHMLGAAIHRSEGWADLPYATTNGVFNYFSQNDNKDLLLYNASIAFSSKPVGMLGFGSLADYNDMVTDVDVTDQVFTHSAYFDAIELW